MKQRYNRRMEGVRPSPAFLNHLEAEMNRALRPARRSSAAWIAVCAAMIPALILGVLWLRGPAPDRTASHSSLQSNKAQPTAAERNVPSIPPSPAPKVSESPAPTPSESPEPLMWLMQGGAWPSFSPDTYDTLTMCLADRDRSIRDAASPDAPVVFTLHPGDAWWPVYDGQEGADESSDATRVQYWDGEAIQTGWLNPDEGSPADPLPYTLKRLPGKLREDARLLYARDESAPASAELPKDSLVYVYAHMGNWVYVTDHGFGEETTRMGWLPADSLYLMTWNDPASLGRVELLADQVNLRETPGGKVITTLSREDASSLRSDSGIIVETKQGRWLFVIYHSKKDLITGYISADYATVCTVTLGESLRLDEVISAELCIRQASGKPVSFQKTIDGAPLNDLCERLKTASSASSNNHLCAPGVAEILLTYDGGDTVTLALSGDDCPYLGLNGMVYQYRTPSEQSEAFLNDGGVSGRDILTQYFGEYPS